MRVTGDTGGRGERRGAVAEVSGRNPGDGRRSVSKHPLAEDRPIAEQIQLMERVVERSNMQTAYKRVKRNKGAPGVDGMTVSQLGIFLRTHWPKIKERLCEGSFEPMPVRRTKIPRTNEGTRSLGIPTVLDRLIQQALHQVLSPIFEHGVFRFQFWISSGSQRAPGGTQSAGLPA